MGVVREGGPSPDRGHKSHHGSFLSAHAHRGGVGAAGVLLSSTPGCVPGSELRGADTAKDLQRLLNRKDDSQYGVAFVSAGEASRMVGWAKRLLGTARRAVEA